jgi:hypothetical protein
MVVPYQNSTAILYSHHPDPPEGTVIQICSIEVPVQDSQVMIHMLEK